jgi:hypothetical protein
MRKQVERIQGRGTLTLDGTTVLIVSYGITVYQKYVDTSGYGGKSYDPGTFEIEGTVTPEDVTGFAVQCGQETNVLDVGKGRRIDINTPGSPGKGGDFRVPYLREGIQGSVLLQVSGSGRSTGCKVPPIKTPAVSSCKRRTG